MAKDPAPVPSPKGDGCLLTKVNMLWDVLFTGGAGVVHVDVVPYEHKFRAGSGV